MKFENLILDPLTAVTSIDGRYAGKTKCLRGYFSEFALIYHRWCMEIYYFLALDDYQKEYGIIRMPALTDEQREFLVFSVKEEKFAIELAQTIKKIEKTTNHDVKAVEYVLKEILREQKFEDAHLAHIHFALTSEDVNNFSYASMLMTALDDVIIPAIEDRYNDLLTLANRHADKVMIARTHGQPATPTTFGKEMQIFSKRIKRDLDKLYSYKVRVKLNGPSGNYNGHMVAYPQVNWPEFVVDFVDRYYNLGKNDGRYVINNWTNQIEDHDSFSELFSILSSVNTILLKFSKDVWLYISYEMLTQKTKKGEVGSSAMPHKVNPINFENAEGNLMMANTLFEMFIRNLPDSRMQRHLSDSTIIRNFGTAFGHCLIAYDNLEKGVEKIEVNEAKMLANLDEHAEVISEAYQLILKREGHENAYELLKEFSRGRKQTLLLMHEFVDTLPDVSDVVKDELKAITPLNYFGLAKTLAAGSPVTDLYKNLR